MEDERKNQRLSPEDVEKRIRHIKKGEKEWPGRLYDLAGMPEDLYVIGELPRDDAPSVAVVGSRLCRAYGHAQAENFGRVLAEHGVQIISGMALGIDGYAQRGALTAGGKTFAVLGSGVDICYPRSNRKLYKDIMDQGGLLSEFEPGTQPYSYNFPQRNRLISALADIVLVVEARRKSGSLITVDFALDQGRTVFAVPGRVGDALSDGCNYLIAQGAGIAWSPEALLEELAVRETMASYARKARADHARRLAESLPGLDAAVRGKDGVLHVHRQESLQLALKEEDLSENARLLLPHLTSDPKGAEELNAETGMEPARIMDGLIELALSGLCEELGRGRFVKIAQNSGVKL